MIYNLVYIICRKIVFIAQQQLELLAAQFVDVYI